MDLHSLKRRCGLPSYTYESGNLVPWISRTPVNVPARWQREGRQETTAGARYAARMREGGAAMDELVARSSDGAIEFALTWQPRRPTTTAAEATRGCLRVSLRGRAVWHGADEDAGFEWTWVELLEFLAESWLYLAIEDGAPFGVALDTAPRMLAAAEAAVDSRSSLGSDVEHEQLEAYRTTHDLAEAVQGAVMPPLWIVRAGNSGWAASTATTARVPFDELLSVLSEVGDAIASRLDRQADERSRAAIETWLARDDHGRLKIIEAATGLPTPNTPVDPG